MVDGGVEEDREQNDRNGEGKQRLRGDRRDDEEQAESGMQIAMNGRRRPKRVQMRSRVRRPWVG